MERFRTTTKLDAAAANFLGIFYFYLLGHSHVPPGLPRTASPATHTPTRLVCSLRSMDLHDPIVTQIPSFVLASLLDLDLP